jgi:hypothetical protein
MENQEVSKIGVAENRHSQAQETLPQKKAREAKDKILHFLSEIPFCNFKEAYTSAGISKTWAYQIRQYDREFDLQVEAALQSNREDVVDVVESKLWARVMEKDKNDPKTEKWVLETLGKRRGYVKRIEAVGIGASGFAPGDLDSMNGEEAANAYTTMLNARGTAS